MTNLSAFPVTIEHARLVVRVHGQKEERVLLVDESMQPGAKLERRAACTFKEKTDGVVARPAGALDHAYVITSTGLKRRSWYHRLHGQDVNNMEADINV